MIKAFLYSLILIFSALSSFCQNPKGPEQWEEEVKSFARIDSINGILRNGIVFTGSSSIRLWKDLQQRFPNKKIINRGIGGSEISDIIFYADELIYPYKPAKIFLYCGSNDIWNGKTPETVLADFKTLYSKIKYKLPSSKIYYISIQGAPSRVEKTEEVKRANQLIKAYLVNSTQDVFIDVFPLLLDQNGNPRSEFYDDDMLHMNSKGYDRWERVIRPYLEK